MAKRLKQGALTASEKTIVKALLARKWRNQDIQALINLGREATINSARITGVKQDASQEKASDEDVERYRRLKRSFDPKTGLNPFLDERLIRSREAMLLAVNVFNSPTLQFRSEVFCILSNIAWTYMLHEFFSRQSVSIVRDNGETLSLSDMLRRQDCPLNEGVRNNLLDIKKLRDKVEHSLLQRGDIVWISLFQANCLNFDKSIRELFGERLGLAGDLGVALHFARMDIHQLETVQKFDVPSDITALNKEMLDSKTAQQRDDLEYRFSVVYTMSPASKAKAGFRFVSPDSEEAEKINNILVKYKSGDHLYPYKAQGNRIWFMPPSR